VEGAYQGHTNNVEDFDGRLTTNKVQVDVSAGPELNAPVPWRPYAAAGLGVNIVTTGADEAGLDNAVQGSIPFSVGADFFTESPIQIGLRGTYDLKPGVGGDVSDDQGHPDEWTTTLNAQAAF